MSFPANVIPVFGSQRAYADLNFAGGSFGLDGRIVNDLTLLSGYSFTRASLATMFDSTGAMTYGPNNLLVRSQEFDNGSWNKISGGTGSAPVITANQAVAPDGTMTADLAVFTLNGGTASGDNSSLTQSVTTPSPNLTSLWAMTSDGSSKVFSLLGPGGTLKTITITGVWQRFDVLETGVAAAAVRLRLRGSASGEGTATSASIYLWGAQLEAVTYQTTPSTYYPTTSAAYYGARLVYDPVTLASQGILVEEARTNLCLQSQDFATTWSVVSGMSVTANATTDPAGTSLADKVIGKVGSSSQAIYQPIVTSAAAYTVSVYAKPAGYNWIGLGFGAGTTVDGAFFNVSTGAIGTVAASSTAKITALPNGWYRCEVTRTLSAGTNYFQAEVHNADNQGNWSANGTDGLYLWQAQLE